MANSPQLLCVHQEEPQPSRLADMLLNNCRVLYRLYFLTAFPLAIILDQDHNRQVASGPDKRNFVDRMLYEDIYGLIPYSSHC